MTIDEQDTRDRTIAQGERLEHLSRRVDEMFILLTEMRDTLNNTKGAWKVIVIVSGFVGFCVANIQIIKSWLLGH